MCKKFETLYPLGMFMQLNRTIEGHSMHGIELSIVASVDRCMHSSRVTRIA